MAGRGDARRQLPGGAEGGGIPQEAEGTPDVPQLKCMSDINCVNVMHTAHLLTLQWVMPAAVPTGSQGYLVDNLNPALCSSLSDPCHARSAPFPP